MRVSYWSLLCLVCGLGVCGKTVGRWVGGREGAGLPSEHHALCMILVRDWEGDDPSGHPALTALDICSLSRLATTVRRSVFILILSLSRSLVLSLSLFLFLSLSLSFSLSLSLTHSLSPSYSFSLSLHVGVVFGWLVLWMLMMSVLVFVARCEVLTC
jgi:hypothetical protein